MNFRDLNMNSALLNALDDLGLQVPTTIQERAFSVVMSGRDVVGLAQTGTGKTFAYLLPLLRMYSFSKTKDPKILILVPTRELVAQVVEQVEKLSKYMTIRVGGVYGGTNMNTHIKLVFDGLDILVGTPGRLIDLALNGVLKLKAVQKLVIDEVDEMLDLGFRQQLNTIFEMMSSKRQNLMFSATLTPEVSKMIDEEFKDPIRIEAAPHGTPLENINQTGFKVPNFMTKVNLLVYLLNSDLAMSKVLVFTKSKRMAILLHEKLEEGCREEFAIIHSNKSQNTRFNALSEFSIGFMRVMVATDLVARGLDIQGVSHVVNFDFPEETTDYIHRIGRTGRAEAKGEAITFVTKEEQDAQKEVEKLMKLKLAMVELPKEVAVSDIVMEFEKKVLPGMEEREVYLKVVPGAFHEKKDKNKKENQPKKETKRRFQNKSKSTRKKPKR